MEPVDGWTETPELRMFRRVHAGAGSARPLLLVHGGGSTVDTEWASLLPMLAERGPVVAVEEEGHGRTSATARPLTSDASARDVVAVLDDLGFPVVDVLAFSAGCRTALALAVGDPRRVGSLVLCSPPWRRDAMIDGFWDGMANGSLADMPQAFQDEFLRLNPGDLAGLQRFFDLDIGHMQEADQPDAALAAITAPTLVVVGDRDVVTVDGAERLATTLPGARLLVLPAGHGDYLGDDPELFGRTAPFLTAFLDRPVG